MIFISARVQGIVSIVVERYGNGSSKRLAPASHLILLAEDSGLKHTDFLCRYLLDDDDSPLQGILEERENKPANKSQGSNSSENKTLWLPDLVKDFVFPTGFPGTC